MGGTTEKAKEEFKVLKQLEETPIVLEFENEILSLVDRVSKVGLSGGSAPFYAKVVGSVVEDLILQKPISPILCNDDEWIEREGGIFQNNRCSALFKSNTNPHPYFLDAIVFQGEEEGDVFTGMVEEIESKQKAKIPFTPKTFYVDVVKEVFNEEKHNESERYSSKVGHDFVYRIKDRNQLKEVFKYYEQ